MTIGGVTLPSPDWSDSYALGAKLHLHRMMSGAVYTYVHDTVEANWRHISYQFSNVSITVYDSLVTYLKAQAGSTITVVDHASVTWTGYQVTNPVVFTKTHRGVDQSLGPDALEVDEETGSFTFEFEGYHA